MKYIYRGTQVTYHPTLGELRPGVVGEADAAVVLPVIQAGLVEPVADWPPAIERRAEYHAPEASDEA